MQVFALLRQIISYTDLWVSKVVIKKSVLKVSKKNLQKESSKMRDVLCLKNIFYFGCFYYVFLIGAEGKHSVNFIATVH